MTDLEKILADAQSKLAKMLSSHLDDETITDKEMNVLLGLLKHNRVTAAIDSADMDTLKTHIPPSFVAEFDKEFKENGGDAYN